MAEINYKELYEQALERIKDIYEFYKDNPSQNQNFIDIFPELRESEDERVRKRLIDYFKNFDSCVSFNKLSPKEILTWFEKQGGKKPQMIQWNGDNLRDVIVFTGTYHKFKQWFRCFEDYEFYVHTHGDIFKLFNEDGSHYEVPVGAWIVKTPDGYNAVSKATFKQKPAEWTKEDEEINDAIIKHLEGSRALSVDLQSAVCWVENIKDRVQPHRWKPSGEQIETLEKAILYIESGDSNFKGSGRVLETLLEQLKKL